MEKIKYVKIKYIDDIIEKLAQKTEIKRAITRSNLYKFWAKAAGEKFSKNSKPYSMLRGGTMVIACKTPTVAQELLLKKMQILVKFQPYAQSLHIKVQDLKFDPKKWIEEKAE